MDSSTYAGFGLMIAGVLIFVSGRRRSKRVNVQASEGSVAVGGDNSGQITNINTASAASPHSGGHAITILAVIVELVGIAVVVWHAIHLTAK